MLSLPNCNIKNVLLVQSNLRYDFLQKLYASFQSQYKTSNNSSSSNNNDRKIGFASINLSRNSIEDKGIGFMSNMFKEMPNVYETLTSLSLSKCSISSKGVNALFVSLSQSKNLTTLDLSHNFLKDDPVVCSFYTYLEIVFAFAFLRFF
jgi:hypothetical protein